MTFLPIANSPNKPTPIGADKLVGTDSADGSTKNFRVDALATVMAAQGPAGAGAAPVAPVTLTSAATLVAAHNGSTYVNSTSAAVTATLPAASGVAAGTRHTVKWTAGGNAATVAGGGTGGMIDGAATLVMPSLQAAYTFEADGTANSWRIV